MFRCHFKLLRMCVADFYQFKRMISTVMKTLVLVIIAGIFSGSQCLNCSDPTYNLKLGIGEHVVEKLPSKSRLYLDCGRVSDCVSRNETTSIEWSKDGLNITGNHTYESVYFSHDRRLLIDGLSEGIGMGNGTEGNYTCKVCLGQACNESTLPIIVDKGVILSFEQCEYDVIEGNHSVNLTLIASQATNFNYTVEISVDDVDTTPGLDYSEPMEVTFEANQTTAEVPIQIVNDFIAERKESFKCSISHISSQNISWNKVPAIVNIADDDILEVNFSGPLIVQENVSNTTLTIQTNKKASFEYTMCLTDHGLNKTGDINFMLSTNTVVFKPYQDMATVDILISGNNIGESDAFVIFGTLPNANNTSNVTIAGLVIIEDYYYIDECMRDIDNCSHGCVNTEGSYYCTCPNGFEPRNDSRTCVDINECMRDIDGCSDGCVNTDGSYYCTCPNGYELSNDSRTCVVVQCPEEFDIFKWPKTRYGSSAEANCSDMHPAFGSSKAKRRCLQNGTWDRMDLTSCTFRNTTGKTPIFLINATINGRNTTEVLEMLVELANNYSSVTKTLTLNTPTSNQTVVTFVIEFSENTTPASRNEFINAVRSSPQFEYVLGVIPSDQCSCDISEQAINGTRELCIGTADAQSPCVCTQNENHCQCVAPYISVTNTEEGTCTLITAQNGCPVDTDEIWNITWMMTDRNRTLNVNCPGDSVGVASRTCRSNGTWAPGKSILIECVSKAFQDFQMESYKLLEELFNLTSSLNDEQRQLVTNVTLTLLGALNSSIFPGDLHIATDFIQNLTRLSENNGLFDGPNRDKLQDTVVDVLNTLVDSSNGRAFINFKDDGTSKVPSPAVTLLNSTERLIRSGFVPSNESQASILVDDNIAIQANRLNLSSFPATFPNGNFSAFMKADMIPQVVIPGSIIERGVSAVPGVVSFTLDNIQDYLPLQFANETDKMNFTGHVKPGSLIVSSQVVDVNTTTVNGSRDSVNITFPLLDNITVGESKIHCAFWDFNGRNGLGGWSFEGVSTESFNSTHAHCASKHLTSFLVLVSPVPIEQKELSADPLSWLTYIGCGISLLFLMLCIIFFLSLRKELITHTHNFVHLNLCIALSCGLLFYLGGIRPATMYDIPCKMVTAFLHYFFLAAFSWMLCEAIMIYIFTVEVFGANKRKWIYMYLLLGWGLPIPVVIASVAAKHNDYLIKSVNNNTVNFACWLPLKDGLVYAFIGPMIAILIVNLVLIIISMTSLVRSKFGMPTQVEQKPKEGAIVARKLIKAFLVLLPLMGFTWIIGLLAVGLAREALSYVFIVLNSLQGLFIFIFHVVRHDKVWSKIKTIVPARTRRKLKRMTIQKFKPKSIDLNDSDKKFEITDTFKTFSSLGDGKDARLVSERREKSDSDSSVNMKDIEMENRHGMSTSNQTNMESSVASTNIGVNEPGNDGEIVDVPAHGKDTLEPLKRRCQQATELSTTVVIEPQSLGESN